MALLKVVEGKRNLTLRVGRSNHLLAVICGPNALLFIPKQPKDLSLLPVPAGQTSRHRGKPCNLLYRRCQFARRAGLRIEVSPDLTGGSTHAYARSRTSPAPSDRLAASQPYGRSIFSMCHCPNEAGIHHGLHSCAP